MKPNIPTCLLMCSQFSLDPTSPSVLTSNFLMFVMRSCMIFTSYKKKRIFFSPKKKKQNFVQSKKKNFVFQKKKNFVQKKKKKKFCSPKKKKFITRIHNWNSSGLFRMVVTSLAPWTGGFEYNLRAKTFNWDWTAVTSCSVSQIVLRHPILCP